ncbi:small multi-drug export protein [Natronobacterium texcoconense]|uniref:Putative small multi-drug export protein n=1 Tax=Natronobacterium texcoconense TaxID=1095778 RepID=A0A1H1EY25_NATTX|nr:small multi-drug export protein [Natronobacterium texcoconense]SDQ93580.1 Putative small multi-drug export protein [Natronobacterium texcoconense]
MSLVPLLVDVSSTIEEATGFLQYLLVFVFAAIPVIEILVVIPIAIGLGLDPVLTGAVAFAGNVLSVYALVVFYRRVANWLQRRRDDESEPSDRYARARRLWDRYGLPGLALGGPVLAGVHVAALVALLAGSRSRTVAAWMTTGIFVWTIVLVAASAYGVSVLGIA